MEPLGKGRRPVGVELLVGGQLPLVFSVMHILFCELLNTGDSASAEREGYIDVIEREQELHTISRFVRSATSHSFAS